MEAADDYGNRPFHLAAANGRLDVAQFLYKKGPSQLEFQNLMEGFLLPFLFGFYFRYPQICFFRNGFTPSGQEWVISCLRISCIKRSVSFTRSSKWNSVSIHPFQ